MVGFGRAEQTPPMGVNVMAFAGVLACHAAGWERDATKKPAERRERELLISKTVHPYAVFVKSLQADQHPKP